MTEVHIVSSTPNDGNDVNAGISSSSNGADISNILQLQQVGITATASNHIVTEQSHADIASTSTVTSEINPGTTIAAATAAVATTNNSNTPATTSNGSNSWAHIANHDDNDMVRRWRESPFAVGLTHPTWHDEPIHCHHLTKTPIAITALCCRPWSCCVGRVGNMIVLLQRNVSYSDPSSTTAVQRPKLLIVLGPYWFILLFFTIPIFALLSAYTFYSVIRREESIILFVVHLLSTCGLFVSLLLVGCNDPGILYRHTAPPAVVDRQEEWQWNDQALTYRPIQAKYDAECAVVIEQFDHTCPWTGTAIGKKNIFWFRIFVIFVLVDILLNAILLTFL